MSKKYNGLNSIKTDLSKSGICAACGRRFTDPLCTHATPDQIEYTAKMDAEIDAEYDRKRTLNELIHRPTEIETTAQECELISKWLCDNTVDVSKNFNGYKATASKTWAQKHLN